MRTAVSITAIGALVALTWCAAEAALCLRAWREFPAQVASRVDDRIQEAMLRADDQISGARADAMRELTRTRRELLLRVDNLASLLDARSGEIQRDMAATSVQLGNVASAATSLVEDARPGVRAWSNLSPALAANALGLVAAAKVTAGQTAQTMREIERATPELIQSVKVSATASQQAAQSAAQTSANLAQITKPGPRWLRWVGIGTSIAVPASQVALPFAAVAAGK